MSFCSTKNCLHYASPAHGGWGIVRVGMLVPQSHQLFVCPFACGRHGAIGAIQQGLKDRLSYLYLTESDIVDGYEDLILKEVGNFIKYLNDDIKAIFIVVSCLDDLIGTDTISLRFALKENYPSYDFQICHMNPISGDTNSPPLVTIQKNIYELLDKKSTDKKSILSIGNFEALDNSNDIKKLLKENGYSLNHISETKTYTEFKDLGNSSLSIVIAPAGLASAKQLEKDLNIPYLFLPTSYSMIEIREQYNKIFSFLNIKIDENYFNEKEKYCKILIDKAKKVIGERKLIVSSKATNRVFSFSLAMLNYGFKIDTIFAQVCPKIETEAKHIIETNYKEIEIKQVIHHTMIKRIPNKRDCVSIGIEGSYAVDSMHPVQMEGDHKMYGYQGIELLMQSIIDSIENPKTIQELLDIYKLVI